MPVEWSLVAVDVLLDVIRQSDGADYVADAVLIDIDQQADVMPELSLGGDLEGIGGFSLQSGIGHLRISVIVVIALEGAGVALRSSKSNCVPSVRSPT